MGCECNSPNENKLNNKSQIPPNVNNCPQNPYYNQNTNITNVTNITKIKNTYKEPQIDKNKRNGFIDNFLKKNIGPINSGKNGIFIQNQKKKMIISEKSIVIETEMTVTVRANDPSSFFNRYGFLIDSKANELSSIDVYVDGKKLDKNSITVRDFSVDIGLGNTFNGQNRIVKVIQKIKKQIENYGSQPLMLNEQDEYVQFIIYGDDHIRLDDISNKYYKFDKELNLAYFEGKTTRETIQQHGFVHYSKKFNSEIYNYIPEYLQRENQIILNKSNTNESKIIVLAIYKKIIFTEYGQEIDELYKIKVINYPGGSYVTSYYFGLLQNIQYDIVSVEVNGRKADYAKHASSILFNNFGALNNQFGEIHVKYKYYTNTDKNIVRKESMITLNTKDTYCKIIVCVPDNYVLLTSSDYFQRSPENNNILVYNGISNQEEIKDCFQFCVKKGTWDIYQEFTLSSLSHIEKCKFIMNRLHKGGNLIEKQYDIINNYGGFTDDITEDKFIFNFNKLNTNKITLGFKINVENSTSNYKVIEKADLITKIPGEDKQFFISLSNMILNNDKSNLPVYKKLGKWVHNYLTYNINLRGKKFTAKQIYDIKQGVCEHFTLLYNTLLVSQGIDAIHVSGYALDMTENNVMKENEYNKPTINQPNYLESSKHAWSLAKVDGEWIPIDATWNMFEKNVPITHIFQNYGKTSFFSKALGSAVESKNTKEIIKYIKT